MAAQHGHGLTRGEWEKSTSFPALSPANHRADAHTCAASCARLGAAQEKPVPAACDSVGTGSHWRAAGLATEGSHQRCKHRVRPRCHAHGGQSPLPPGWAAGACTPWRWPRALCRQPPLGAHSVRVMNRAHGGRASLLTPAATLWGGRPCPLSRAASCGPGAALCRVGARRPRGKAHFRPVSGLCRGL